MSAVDCEIFRENYLHFHFSYSCAQVRSERDYHDSMQLMSLSLFVDFAHFSACLFTFSICSLADQMLKLKTIGRIF